MLSSLQPPFFQAISSAERVLVAGMGGGFDVFCGLPLYFALKEAGKMVFLANYSFTPFAPRNPLMPLSALEQLAPALVEVTPDLFVQHGEYFPEYHLSRWLQTQREPNTVYAFRKGGVQPLHTAYAALVKHLELDTIILVDGGSDSLMRGDELGLGTPHEDMTSLVAVNELSGIRAYLACLGFGVDAFHGVCHARYLEATAELTQEGAFLGAFSLTPDMRPMQLYKDACEAVFEQMPWHISIVNSSIVSAVYGAYGDHHLTERTRGSELWINPLMGLYWTYHLPAVAARLQYYRALLGTNTVSEVDRAIHEHRSGRELRPWVSIPV